MNNKYILVFIIGVILISLPSMIATKNQNEKYRLHDEISQKSVTISATVTETYIVKITAMEQETQQMFLDSNGEPTRIMRLYYNVKYDSGITDIHYVEVAIPFDTEIITNNNVIKKNFIESYAITRWNWSIPNQKYGYDKLSTGNQ